MLMKSLHMSSSCPHHQLQVAAHVESLFPASLTLGLPHTELYGQHISSILPGLGIHSVAELLEGSMLPNVVLTGQGLPKPAAAAAGTGPAKKRGLLKGQGLPEKEPGPIQMASVKHAGDGSPVDFTIQAVPKQGCSQHTFLILRPYMPQCGRPDFCSWVLAGGLRPSDVPAFADILQANCSGQSGRSGASGGDKRGSCEDSAQPLARLGRVVKALAPATLVLLPQPPTIAQDPASQLQGRVFPKSPRGATSPQSASRHTSFEEQEQDQDVDQEAGACPMEPSRGSGSQQAVEGEGGGSGSSQARDADLDAIEEELLLAGAPPQLPTSPTAGFGSLRPSPTPATTRFRRSVPALGSLQLDGDEGRSSAAALRAKRGVRFSHDFSAIPPAGAAGGARGSAGNKVRPNAAGFLLDWLLYWRGLTPCPSVIQLLACAQIMGVMGRLAWLLQHRDVTYRMQ